MNRILIAEDEAFIVSFLEKGFKAHGFITAVARNGYETISMASSEDFDLLILDIGLPGKNGWIVLEELRQRGEQMPIIILTARDGVKDKVAGLEGGADDYVTKPFGFEELLARVRLRLRDKRSPNGTEEMVLKASDIVLDLHKRQVKVSDRLIELSAREFTLAEVFLRHPGELLTREKLLDRVWGYDYDPGSNIVDVYVGYLRKKLGGDRIETVRGQGYRLRI
ncbi:response regulator transcription factor [Phormidium sp. LEGE 05292]|uniref:response regulator transcription factor n=1 Tax=[Phormidium] sp. LEGE 05292 TaxID=767427 RepID=UPI001880BC2C|nr:response regulator transcription factor [Phormidium sp. LEGE 05292]MBE9224498.1 response regulator transcription factor [Phormidium sp. LEGE 05292]